ncbi:AsnC family transcriptional regulator, partial [Pseudomonas ogarae]
MPGVGSMAFRSIRSSTQAGAAADSFEAMFARLPVVLSCHKITEDADYVLQVLAEDLDSYSDLI